MNNTYVYILQRNFQSYDAINYDNITIEGIYKDKQSLQNSLPEYDIDMTVDEFIKDGYESTDEEGVYSFVKRHKLI